MLTACGRAPPFGDLAKCATAAGADAGAGIQLADFLAWRWRADGHLARQNSLWSIESDLRRVCAISATFKVAMIGYERLNYLPVLVRVRPSHSHV